MGNLNNPVKYVYTRNTLAYASPVLPTINVWETALTVTGGFECGKIGFSQANTPVDDKNVEVRVTIDGDAYTVAQVPATDSEDYCVHLQEYMMTDWCELIVRHSAHGDGPLDGRVVTDDNAVISSGKMRGQDLLVEIRTTEVVNAGTVLSMEAIYHTVESV